ncbi:hypothetical protein WR25_22934 isoform B [Diploscapter pachys]|uniref:Globin family profile domain-containing protein n=1 Tax=Diploscapter pachys TaxID=2018661 RepID=A0A2A2L5Z4_9BILA|nr:hypothetical protein WR25_22934 isoform B [Diploscapter pachys]
MFLIAKIVRGRRLLHELEQQEKDEAAANADHLQAPRRGQIKHRRSSPVLLLDDAESPTETRGRQSRRSSCLMSVMRQKTESGDTLDIEKGGLRRTSSMPSLCEMLPSTSRRIYDYDSKLTKLQKKALKFTWSRLQTRNGGKRVESVFEDVFDRVVRYLPQTREMFNTRAFLCAISRNETSSLRDHARVIFFLHSFADLCKLHDKCLLLIPSAFTLCFSLCTIYELRGS